LICFKISFKINRLQQEIDQVIGSKQNITFEDTLNLKYTSMVYKETLRLWNPAQLISRLTDKPMTINGYHIPPGVLVTV
jgi:cytochrome P450